MIDAQRQGQNLSLAVTGTDGTLLHRTLQLPMDTYSVTTSRSSTATPCGTTSEPRLPRRFTGLV